MAGRLPKVASFGWLLVAAGRRGWPACGHDRLWLRFAGRMPGMTLDPMLETFWLLPRSVDLRLSSSQADSPCLARRDALDVLTVVATLAHELFWTCDCLEDPRRRAADSRRQRPFNRAGAFCPLH